MRKVRVEYCTVPVFVHLDSRISFPPFILSVHCLSSWRGRHASRTESMLFPHYKPTHANERYSFSLSWIRSARVSQFSLYFTKAPITSSNYWWIETQLGGKQRKLWTWKLHIIHPRFLQLTNNNYDVRFVSNRASPLTSWQLWRNTSKVSREQSSYST